MEDTDGMVRGDVVIDTDSRGRLPLAKVLKGKGSKRFRVERLKTGQLLCTPLVDVEAMSLTLANPDE